MCLKNIKELSTSKALGIIITELRKSGGLVSCIITDENGLIMAEAIHPRDDKENLSATTAMIINSSEKISDYLKIGTIGYCLFLANDTKIWLKAIDLPKCNDRFLLLAVKRNTYLENLHKSTLKSLGKTKVIIPALLDAASYWISKACEE